MRELGRPPVRVGVLGPLQLAVNGDVVDVPGPKRRALLAMLALAEDRAVTVEMLVDALWPEEASDTTRNSLHSHVSRLRGHLGAAACRLETVDGGYRLALADGLDAGRARSLLTMARAQANDEPSVAHALLREALELWRGPALAGLSEVVPLAVAATGLDELQRQIGDLFVETAILAGDADSVVDLAAQAVAEDPLREQAVLLRMRALAATGQAPEALASARTFRHRLAEEVGLDPTPALSRLERDIADGSVGRASPTLVRPPVPPSASTRSGATRSGATRLLGREAHLASVSRLLQSEQLVTVVGPGGVGKTRLALEIARSAGQATVLFLAPITQGDAVPLALAEALGLTATGGAPLAACTAVLCAQPALLMIDNCEHLLDPVRDLVARLLDTCPGLTVLATSRERLGLPTECASRLAPLPVPSADHRNEPLLQVPSVALFVDRAARARPGFDPTPGDLHAVADIVRRLDGVPLAIELAAGRLSSLAVADLHERLDRALDLLVGGRPSTDARHRTLRATVEWSYRLLTAPEQRLFRHLAVFVDGVDLATAESVAAELDLSADPGAALAHLVDASMIEVDLDGDRRYRMLDTLRAFGLHQLVATGEHDAATDRLVRWAVRLTEWIDTCGATENEADADAVLRRSLPNLRAAWSACRRRGALDAAAAIVVNLYETASWRDLIEFWAWADELLANPALAGHPRRGAVLGCAAGFAYQRGDYPAAARTALTGLDVARDPASIHRCLGALSLADLSRGSPEDAVEHALAAAALATRPTENPGIAALAAAYAGDLDRARTYNRRLELSAVNPTLRAFGSYVAAEIDALDGRTEQAHELYTHAVDLARTVGATFVDGVATVGRLALMARTGRPDQALSGFRDVIAYFSRTGNWTHLWTTLRNLADLLRTLDDAEPADVIDAAADWAPDAPPAETGRRPPAPLAGPASPGRLRVLEVAYEAIDRNLRRQLIR